MFDNNDDATSKDILGVDSWWVLNTSIAYRYNDQTSFQLNIDNLFNEQAPHPATASGRGISTYFSGVQERYVTFTVRKSF